MFSNYQQTPFCSAVLYVDFLKFWRTFIKNCIMLSKRWLIDSYHFCMSEESSRYIIERISRCLCCGTYVVVAIEFVYDLLIVRHWNMCCRSVLDDSLKQTRRFCTLLYIHLRYIDCGAQNLPDFTNAIQIRQYCKRLRDQTSHDSSIDTAPGNWTLRDD